MLKGPTSDGRKEIHDKNVCALKELIRKMSDYLAEANEVSGGKQLHSVLDMGSLKSGDRKRSNVPNKKSHALVSGLQLQFSRALVHIWSKLRNTCEQFSMNWGKNRKKTRQTTLL